MQFERYYNEWMTAVQVVTNRFMEQPNNVFWSSRIVYSIVDCRVKKQYHVLSAPNGELFVNTQSVAHSVVKLFTGI